MRKFDYSSAISVLLCYAAMVVFALTGCSGFTEDTNTVYAENPGSGRYANAYATARTFQMGYFDVDESAKTVSIFLTEVDGDKESDSATYDYRFSGDSLFLTYAVEEDERDVEYTKILVGGPSKNFEGVWKLSECELKGDKRICDSDAGEFYWNFKGDEIEVRVASEEIFSSSSGTQESSCSQKEAVSSSSSSSSIAGTSFNAASSSSITGSSSSIAANSSSSVVDSSSSIENTSSSAVNTSSSAEVSSSSIASSSSGYKKEWRQLNPSINYGTMVDERDGEVYKTVKIGTQTWMAENLNYDYKVPEAPPSSFVYLEPMEGMLYDGRYYLWSAAMDSAALFSDAGKGCGDRTQCHASGRVRGVCPEGWHLPSTEEWKVLLELAGGSSAAVMALSSDLGWNIVYKGENTDDFGFSAIGSGYRDDTGSYAHSSADFWSSRESEVEADPRFMADHFSIHEKSTAFIESMNKKYALTVRCVEDDDL